MNGITRRALRYGVPTVVAVVLYFVASEVRLSLVTQFTSLALLAVLAMAWNLVGGFGGQFSLGHALFVGAGGYTTVVLLDRASLPLFLCIPLAGLVAAILGVVLAYPMLRLRGPYFAIGTLGISLAVLGWMLNWDFTYASRSYALAPSAIPSFLDLGRVSLVVALLTLLVVLLIMDMPLGLRLLALRDDEQGAIMLGARRVRTIVPVWAISAFLTGTMGALVAVQAGSVTPTQAFSLQFTLDAVIICVIGGLGTVYGPLLGAVVVFVLRQYTADFSEWSLLIEALIVILIVRFAPLGLLGLFQRLFKQIWRSIGSRGPAVNRDAKTPVGAAQ